MMKKTVSLILAFVMCLSLCACDSGSGSDPLAEEYSTIDEVVNALATHYTNPSEQWETIRSNPSIYEYFQKDHIKDEIWRKLKDVKDENGNSVFSMSKICSIYGVCNNVNGYNDWFERINVGSDGTDIPFIMYGNEKMTVEKLTSSIKSKFKDPDSVSIDNAWICFALPEDANGSNDFLVYEDGFRYVIFAEVRAKNGFGAFDKTICRIEGSVGWTFSVKDTGSSSSLLTRPTTQIEGYGTWSRIL